MTTKHDDPGPGPKPASSDTVRKAGANQDDTASQREGGTSREEAGLPEWEVDPALEERMALDAEANEVAATEDWPAK